MKSIIEAFTEKKVIENDGIQSNGTITNAKENPDKIFSNLNFQKTKTDDGKESPDKTYIVKRII
ncbi:MAG: hypothetical protein WC679_13395 [Bacteroidales bacterium]|jgi:hypothetical protein